MPGIVKAHIRRQTGSLQCTLPPIPHVVRVEEGAEARYEDEVVALVPLAEGQHPLDLPLAVDLQGLEHGLRERDSTERLICLGPLLRHIVRAATVADEHPLKSKRVTVKVTPLQGQGLAGSLRCKLRRPLGTGPKLQSRTTEATLLARWSRASEARRCALW